MEMQRTHGRVWVQTNEPQNRVVEYTRAQDGTLTMGRSAATGGRGSGMPHLTSQGSVVLSGDERFLLVSNIVSDDVSVFSVVGDALERIHAVPTGSAPKSIAEREGLVYVLNTGKPSLAGFRLGDGSLTPIPGAEVMLASAEADPAQVGFTPDGSAVVVTERGTDAIVAYPLGASGILGVPSAVASAGPTPYGFAFTSGGALVVTEAFRAARGAAAASSYRVAGSDIALVSPSVANGRSEICWAVVTKDDRFVFTTNFADGAVSRYAISDDGSLTLEDAAAGVTVDGRPGLRDEDLSRDGRFLYAIDADQGEIVAWAVGRDGALDKIGSWGGLPVSVAGLAAS